MINEAQTADRFDALPEANAGSPERNDSPAETANFQGNWFNRQTERMGSNDFRTKWARARLDGLDSLTSGSPRQFDKPKNFRSSHDEELSYDETLSTVTGQVGYVSARDTSHGPGALGFGKFGEPGTLLRDATSEAVSLTDAQKDIIAAHEAYHGMVDTLGTGNEQVKAGIDWEAYGAAATRRAEQKPTEGEIFSTQYLRNANELTARMAQLKNYYGMAGKEPFTQDHLDYAKANYVTDTGLDNSMSLMLDSVTPKTQREFVRLMNKLPV